ncbi:GDSL esterase/lipase [Nymphaea thermarum]|nr:GDSL esterase/lipase [Nymphaea thermarum]
MAESRAVEAAEEVHPYAFHVSGPRNLSSPNWRDLFCSNPNYRRTVVACFIQAVYLLELDRQENRNVSNALAPKWWKPFKYRETETLVDDIDGSIFGAIFQWDRAAALSDFILMRPSGAPQAVLALRGTILNRPTIRRDLADDLRFLTWESLKGSVRFRTTLEALKSAADKFGSSNICIAGHSLGAGFALQVGKALAKEGVYVETHLFNPPSVSIATGFRSIAEIAENLWRSIKDRMNTARAILPVNCAVQPIDEHEDDKNNDSGAKACKQLNKWIPHLYVNKSDYICCYYSSLADAVQGQNGEDVVLEKAKGKEQKQMAAKLFVMSKGPQKFLEAHGLEQWWSHDLDLQEAHQSKLISRQLRSLYTVQPLPQCKAQ